MCRIPSPSQWIIIIHCYLVQPNFQYSDDINVIVTESNSCLDDVMIELIGND